MTQTPAPARPPAVILIPIHDLVSDDATRLERDEDHINALAADFRQRRKDHPDEHPVQTPLRIVYRAGRPVIVAGSYRYLAGLRAALPDMPCTVLDRDLDEADLLIEAAKDNDMRLAYTPLERARNILRVSELKKCSVAGAAGLLQIKRPTATKLLRVLEHYPADLHPFVGEGDGRVPFTAAYKLTQLHPDEAAIRDLSDKVMRGLFSRDDLDAHVDGLLGKSKPKAGGKPSRARTARGVGLEFPPGLDHDAALAEIDAAAEAIRRAKRNGLPMASLKQLVGRP